VPEPDIRHPSESSPSPPTEHEDKNPSYAASNGEASVRLEFHDEIMFRNGKW